jgi:N-acyl-D-amino-acid deacylase
MIKQLIPVCFLLAFFSCRQKTMYTTIIQNGMIYDGNGGEPYKSDIGINGDTIAFIGDLSAAGATQVVNASGLAVTPGFINMMGHSEVSLLQDGRGQSDTRQGVTTEIFTEFSMGPLNAYMKKQMQEGQGDIKFDVTWNTLGEYMNHVVSKGISPNIASFVGTGTIRQYVVGEDNRDPTPGELDSMRLLVRNAMEEGALGITNALIYPPDFFAKTGEIVALAKEASSYGGAYTSHIRSEGDKLLEGINELITISKEANITAQVHHLKAAGKDNWNKIDSVIAMVNKARSEGIKVSADMYNYTAGATGLTATMPPTLQDGGFGKLRERLQQPAIRAAIKKEMDTKTGKWENFYYATGTPSNILLVGFKQDSLKKFTGKTLAEIAAIRGTTPEETAMDLIVQDSTRVETVFFLMSEDNVKKETALPWVSFGSDEGSYTNEGVFLKSNAHPRAYGNFAKLLGKYVRDEKVISLQQAIYKLSKLPAETFKLKKRGEIKVGNYADIVAFDPSKIMDHATYEKPHQYATGVMQVFINGSQVIKEGEPTNAKPGRFLKGPGYKGKE